jgi:hypothetical protein
MKFTRHGIAKHKLDILILLGKTSGLGYAIYNLLQYYHGAGGLSVSDDVYIHGVPMVRIFGSFLIIAFSSLAESIINIRQKNKLLPK